MTKLNWGKVGRENRERREIAHEARFEDQQRMRTLVRERKLSCFVCGRNDPPAWGKTGATPKSRRIHYWAICDDCLQAKRREVRERDAS